jgi:hypothetical protein
MRPHLPPRWPGSARARPRRPADLCCFPLPPPPRRARPAARYYFPVAASRRRACYSFSALCTHSTHMGGRGEGGCRGRRGEVWGEGGPQAARDDTCAPAPPASPCEASDCSSGSGRAGLEEGSLLANFGP